MASLSRQVFDIELADGSRHRLTSTNADQIAYEETRARRKWPRIDEGGVTTWWTFLTWRAASREGLTSDSYETWAAGGVVDIDNVTDDDESADPTPLVAVPDSP